MTTENETVGDVESLADSLATAHTQWGAKSSETRGSLYAHMARSVFDRIERAHARESAAQVRVPEGWRDFLDWCAANVFVSGGRAVFHDERAFRGRLKSMLSAAPAPAAEPDPKQADDGEALAYLIDWPGRPDLGHYFSAGPVHGTRCRPLYAHPTPEPAPQPAPSDAPASPQAAQGDVEALADRADALWKATGNDDAYYIAHELRMLAEYGHTAIGRYPGNYMPPDSAELERMADTIGAMRVNGFDDQTAIWVVLRIRELASRLASAQPATPHTPSAQEWLESNSRAASKDWIDGWNCCRFELSQPATAKPAPVPTLSDADIDAWLRRHDLESAIRGTDARAAFEDAQTAHLLPESTRLTGGSHD